MTPSEAKRLIRKHIKRWRYLATSYGWKFDVYYADNGHVMPKDMDACYAATNYKSEYLDADIWFNLSLCSELDEKGIEETVIHELTHLVIAPIDFEEEQRKELERVVTMVSRLFMGLRNEKR